MNYLIVIFYKIVSFFSHIKKTVIHTNFSKNSNIISQFNLPDKFIEDQSVYRDFYFGKRDLSYSGCGIIAVYNTLKTLNKTTDSSLFINLISTFEKYGSPFCATIGISPSAILNYFSENNYNTDKIISSDKNKINCFSNKYNNFICLIYNDSKNIKKGLHYVYVKKIFYKDTLSKTTLTENSSCENEDYRNKNKETVSFESHNPNYVSHELYSTICKINNGKAKPLYIIGIDD